MLLLSTLLVPIKPSKKGNGWFEISGRPLRCEYDSAHEYLLDMEFVGSQIISNPKIVGLHNLHNDLHLDPRFSDDDEYRSFGAVEHNDKYYLCMDINVPEALVFSYLLDQDTPEGIEGLPEYRHYSKKTAAALQKKLDAGEPISLD